MKIVRNVLEGIDGIELFAIAGLIIFFAFFITILVKVMRMKQKKVDELSRMPLEKDDDEFFSPQNN
jgi:cytochrome c oxidase cbb3-type subunit IV